MKYVEPQFHLADIFTKVLDAVTFIEFEDMLVVSGSTLNLVVMKSKEPEVNKSEEHVKKKQRK